MAGSNKRRVSFHDSEVATRKLKQGPATEHQKSDTANVSDPAPSVVSMDTDSPNLEKDTATSKPTEKEAEPLSQPEGVAGIRNSPSAEESNRLLQLECYPPPGTLQYEVVNPKVEKEGAHFAKFAWLPLHIRLWAQHYLEDHIEQWDDAARWLIVKVLQPVSSANEGGDFLMIPKMLDAWISKPVILGRNVITIPVGRDESKQFYLVTLESLKARKRLREFKRLDRGVYIGTADLPGTLLLFDVVLKDQTSPKMESLLVGIKGLPELAYKNWVQGCLMSVRQRASNDPWDWEGIFERDFNKPEWSGTGKRIVEVQFSGEKNVAMDDLLSRGKFKQGSAKVKVPTGGINTEPRAQPKAKEEKSNAFARVLDD
ncbi:uncharacterized protein MELLADRAFT_112816 [Melampsora larici-populina 98AG31]|uniref:Uncharacterized protein n=1 Tax=Melampsora larici-populina (strain 98AG31 / pathotype 3-4-7) TaxID=747676 RepID=F4S7R5_MELLP|nr:uncharacterized protein MELLADRAFT_112816 [Melampsora larici-populina 98AG31]EGF99259.1 hypothetical protein MELLADRAFT_112816 [Melampsora larici-populina 98AG31]